MLGSLASLANYNHYTHGSPSAMLPQATHPGRTSLEFLVTKFIYSSQAIIPSEVVAKLFAGPAGVAQAKPPNSTVLCSMLANSLELKIKRNGKLHIY